MHDARPQPERAGSATRRRSSRMLRALALMGPAFIVGAWQFGPGNLTSAIQAGGEYGYTLIWVIVISTALMVVFTDMSVRIGLAARHSLIETAKRTLGRWWGICAGLGVFAITLMFSVGNAVGQDSGCPWSSAAIRCCGHWHARQWSRRCCSLAITTASSSE